MDDLWQCWNCRKKNQNNRTTCWNCGNSKNGKLVRGASSLSEHSEKHPFCVNCATTLDTDAKFCPTCRKPVVVNSTLSCPSCGKTVNAGAKFCKYCAADLQPETVNKTPLVTQSYNSSLQNIQKAKAEKLILGGGATAVVSAFAFFWGVSYTNDFANQARAGLGRIVGQTDPTYAFAQWCVALGAIGFFVGVGLFVYGMSQRQNF